MKVLTPFKAYAVVRVCMNWRIRRRLKKITAYAIELGLITEE